MSWSRASHAYKSNYFSIFHFAILSNYCITRNKFLNLFFAENLKIMEDAVTEGVQVQVESFYIDSHSIPEEDLYVFAYRIRLKNLSQRTVQLLRRHWIITDSNGDINEVRGDGVVGDQPVLVPDEEYEYTSGSQLKSPVGTMQGTYQMTTTDGDEFDVAIPCFTLAVPGMIN